MVTTASQLQVSDILIIEKVHISIHHTPYPIPISDILPFQNQRVPADLILLRTTEKSGTCFVRTDQLDGETDWKLRVATCQGLTSDEVGHVISGPSHVIVI